MAAIWLITGLIILAVAGSLFVLGYQFCNLLIMVDPTLVQKCEQDALSVEYILFPLIIAGTGLTIYGVKTLPTKKGHQLFTWQKHQKVCGKCNYNLSQDELKNHHCNNCKAEWWYQISKDSITLWSFFIWLTFFYNDVA